MPKIKTSRAAAKRFKVTGTGKLKRMKAYKSHILTKKSQKSNDHRCYQCKEHEEDSSVSVSCTVPERYRRIGKFQGGKEKWQELKAV